MTTLLTARSPFLAPLRVLVALVLLLGSLVIALPPLRAQAQSAEDGFDPGANGFVLSLLVQPDGRILVGGMFTSLDAQQHQHIGRLHPDGTVDPACNPQSSGEVLALALQPDGKIVLGGYFLNLNGQSEYNIARLDADGILDETFDVHTDNYVYTLARQPDGKIVVGGAFLDSGYASPYIGRLNPDGTRDTAFDAEANDNVYALALQPDGKILVGGDFTILGDKARSHFGRLSITTAAIQNLSVAADGTSITWQRSGAAPEVERTAFELSVDGAPYVSLGEGTRTTGGWLLEGLSLPAGQNLFVRARGFYSGGRHNGSVSVVESVRNAYVVPLAPAITSAAFATFTVESQGSFAVTTTGLPVAAVSHNGTLPTGVTFTDNGDGTATLAGTPAAGTGGAYPLTITAANGASPDAVQTFTLTVNEPPAIASADSTTFTVGTAGSFTVTTTGHPEPTLTSSEALPGGVTFTDNGDGTATLAGTPTAGTGGVYTLTITAANSVSPDATQSFALTVQERPTITSADTATLAVGEEGSFTVTAAGHPAPNLGLGGSLPPGVIFTGNGDGTATLAGIPAAGTGGVYTLTITAANSVSPDATQSFALTVQEAEPPTPSGTTTYLPLALTN